ncbi:hypothetical protein PI125_g16847 [Phytophthora idaei]|nr:hypothetical protein PI125_g16847 [Phytophthora idaei]KAG3140584.1 hypothetical protein PI126_g15930 [Phytophthora idaei]
MKTKLSDMFRSNSHINKLTVATAPFSISASVLWKMSRQRICTQHVAHKKAKAELGLQCGQVVAFSDLT